MDLDPPPGMEQFLHSSTRIYYELELPRQPKSAKRWPLLLALHGYRGDKSSMMRVARRIAGGKMIVISLQGPNQFFVQYGIGERANPSSFRVGFGWGTTYKLEDSVELHHRTLRALINLAVRKYGADRTRVFLLGFSQPCAYNYRFVFTYPISVRGAVAVCGGVPGDWNQNPRYRGALTHVLHIAATRDEWYSRERNLEFRRQLSQRSASLDFRFYNSPHRFPGAAVPHIRNWIEKHLGKIGPAIKSPRGL